MIKLKKLSASSITTFDMCEMKWLLQYMMNYREPSGKSAAIGTICHYVLECVANSKIARQNGVKFVEDEIVGKIRHKYDIAKWTEQVYDHFTKVESHLEWTDKDYREVVNNLKKAQEHPLFPENHKHILEPEGGFFMPLEKNWAKYTYVEGDDLINGYIQMNGFIDLLFRDDNGILNFVDYKFGKEAKDWVTGKEKSFETCSKDTQLCMYYWALKQRFPNEDIVANLWYVKADYLFTSSFGQDQEDHFYKKLQHTIAKIKSMEKPEPNYSFKCGFCPFKKTNFGDWGRADLDIPHKNVRQAHFPPIKEKACVCDTAKVFLNFRGIDATIENGRLEKNG